MRATKTQINVTEFCRRERITAKAVRADRNPNIDNSDSAPMDHWKVTFHIRAKDGVRTMSVLFSMGLGHNGKAPKADDVLSCLASDYVDGGTDFEQWASDFGLDADSRKAERTFRACQIQSEKLIRFLGEDLTKELVYEVERL